jgi:hypothetical protein
MNKTTSITAEETSTTNGHSKSRSVCSLTPRIKGPFTEWFVTRCGKGFLQQLVARDEQDENFFSRDFIAWQSSGM